MQSLIYLLFWLNKSFSSWFSFDNIGHDDDFIFEEFARIRLKGHEGGLDDTEA